MPFVVIYPFDVEKSPVFELIYFHQFTCFMLLSSSMCINTVLTVFLWYVVVKINLLSKQLQRTTTAAGFIYCIKTHVIMLRYLN